VLLTEQVDLTGGYYDAGDNVKYGLPLAFTVTTLAWTALSFEHELQAAGELKNVHSAIKWGTDYLLKCAAKKNRLWVQVSRPRTFGSLSVGKTEAATCKGVLDLFVFFVLA
jgi:hypothetical protein